MFITKENEDKLLLKMQELNIDERDLIEKFILGSGKGGQKMNKTSSCVYLKHLPTGIEIKCQKGRSREANRFFARRELCEKIEEIVFQKASKKKQEEEKIRRQKKTRSRKQKKKMLEAKKEHGKIKQLRQRPSKDDF